MAFDATVQVAPDSTGSKIDMEGVATDAGITILRQRATIVGPSAEAFQQMLLVQQQTLAVLRGILRTLTCQTNVVVLEREVKDSEQDYFVY